MEKSFNERFTQIFNALSMMEETTKNVESLKEDEDEKPSEERLEEARRIFYGN